MIAELHSRFELQILRKSYAVSPSRCNAITSHPGDFLSGVLGPDIYPDLVIGQTTTHPGVNGAWQTDDWLRHMVRNAMTPREVAFVSGFLVHASSDVFAHSYVNNYTGDVFELGDELAVEIIQTFHPGKYIDNGMPHLNHDLDQLIVPAGFLWEALIFNNQAACQYLT